jgi:peroxiredoxin
MLCRRSSCFLTVAFALPYLAAICPAAQPPETLKIGSPAPDFNLPGVDGEKHSLASFREADVLVIVFTCNHCPTAQAYEDRIKRLAADYRKKNVALVAISPNDPAAVRLDEMGWTDVGDSLDEMKIRAKDHAFNFLYLFDGTDQKVTLAYGPVATPHVFIFDRSRKLRFVGRIDNSEDPRRATTHETRDAIEALLAGRPVPVEVTKTFGCSIKWAEKRDMTRKADEAWAKEEVTLKLIDEQGIKALVRNDGHKLRLLNVWATWCGPCLEELPELVAMNRVYRRRRFEFITISADAPETKDEALKALKDKQVAAQNYLFEGNDKYKLMDAVDKKSTGALPYTLLIAPGGTVVYRKSGPIDPLELKQAIVGYLGRRTYADDVPGKPAVPASARPPPGDK